ncbi:hypothetical protein [Bradyrhizobium sp. SZCCHNS2005]|uniref:hypothetical protein n=1 Tax=Bradyrhizobium sp. SZCCHNS2005 TaxID=3057303 RepID=UPI0028EB56D3|nr:hypothetical protein [Bradyrhizobium sp. SZCCHNS2005]
MPLWVQYSQALATPAIALLAIVIAVLQWRTAHQKIVLDLFERRMKVYSEIRAVIASTVSSGKLPNEKHFEYMRAADGAKFLFGSKVNGYLEDLNNTLAYFHEADETYGDLQGQDRADAIQRRRKYFDKIQAFYKEFDPLVEPYVAMRQRRWF